MQKLFILLGIILILIGIFLPWILKSGIGRLPGDIFIRRENFSFYFPLTTMIILSVVISLIIWFLNR